ncbi:hypothetical protein ApDm4_1188 [Acetobacter pomorum]|nr:hypothetical protein ApDm4_1188 [Acetobacter pomorum]
MHVNSPSPAIKAGGAGLVVIRVGRGPAGAGGGPGVKVIDQIDDAAAKFAEGRATAMAAVFFQRAWGKAENLRGFMSAQVARR